MPVSISKIQTGLRLEEPTYKKITSIAKKNKRSLNAEIEVAVESAIEKFEAAYGAIPLEEEAV